MGDYGTNWESGPKWPMLQVDVTVYEPCFVTLHQAFTWHLPYPLRCCTFTFLSDGCIGTMWPPRCVARNERSECYGLCHKECLHCLAGTQWTMQLPQAVVYTSRPKYASMVDNFSHLLQFTVEYQASTFCETRDCTFPLMPKWCHDATHILLHHRDTKYVLPLLAVTQHSTSTHATTVHMSTV